MSTTIGKTMSKTPASPAAINILFSIAFVHLLNDCVQAVLPSVYPLLKESFALSFTQVGLITLTFQCTASLLQRGSVCTPTAVRSPSCCRQGCA